MKLVPGHLVCSVFQMGTFCLIQCFASCLNFHMFTDFLIEDGRSFHNFIALCVKFLSPKSDVILPVSLILSDVACLVFCLKSVENFLWRYFG